MSITVDKISVTYESIEQLLKRQSVIEKRISDYLVSNPEIADSIQSNIRVVKDKYILEVELLKDGIDNQTII